MYKILQILNADAKKMFLNFPEHSHKFFEYFRIKCRAYEVFHHLQGWKCFACLAISPLGRQRIENIDDRYNS